jgi:CBS-domain-containing membrane protein
MNIVEIMNPKVEVCHVDDSLETAAARMWSRDVGCLPVLDSEDRVIAMVTDRDICMAACTQGKVLADIPVSSAMSRELYFCTEESSVVEVEAIMRLCQIHRLPVVDSNRKVIGIVSLNDLAREAERETAFDFHDISIQGVIHTLAAVNDPRTR